MLVYLFCLKVIFVRDFSGERCSPEASCFSFILIAWYHFGLCLHCIYFSVFCYLIISDLMFIRSPFFGISTPALYAFLRFICISHVRLNAQLFIFMHIQILTKKFQQPENNLHHSLPLLKGEKQVRCIFFRTYLSLVSVCINHAGLCLFPWF